MKLRLAYPHRLVEVDNKTVYVFRNKLLSAPIEEVVGYYLGRDALLPEELKAVAHDVVRAILDVQGGIRTSLTGEVGRKAST
ncbi:hypothetical protein JCM16138_06650 [Thermococcus atlanticus]